ncbi:MAG: hypothetical protein KBS42_02090, partial [Bacteroidales bacterium]|nr:hypothetical protein [Candidatus Colicola coprequi]
TFIKYYNNGGKTTLDLADDAAAANWKGNWRMPTKAEFEELANTQNCEWKWCDGETEKYNNTTVKGYLVTSKTNSNSIFLPVSGYRSNSVLYAVGDRGYYWSSSLYEYSDSNSAYSLYFRSGNIDGGGEPRPSLRRATRAPGVQVISLQPNRLRYNNTPPAQNALQTRRVDS